MLILTRRIGESIIIGDNITVTVLGMRGMQVRLGFEAPSDVSVHREEIYNRILEEKEAQDILADKIPEKQETEFEVMAKNTDEAEKSLSQSELATIHAQTTNGVINTILGGNK